MVVAMGVIIIMTVIVITDGGCGIRSGTRKAYTAHGLNGEVESVMCISHLTTQARKYH